MKVSQVDKVTEEILKVWDSAKKAAEELGIPATNITAVIKKRRKSAGGFKWKLSEIQVESGGAQKIRKGNIKTKNEKSTLSGLSALGADNKIMSIDTYCDHHGLPRKDITSYKLITHTSTPYYNIQFKEIYNEELLDSIDFDGIVEKYLSQVPETIARGHHRAEKHFTRAVYTDAHIGMEPNQNGNSLYGGKWDAEEFIKRMKIFANHIIQNAKGEVLIVDELGDYMDGQGGRTTRKGHELPQNMTDEGAFDTGVYGKVLLADLLVPHFKFIYFRSLVNDNHSGSFSYYVNSAAKSIISTKYPKNVQYTIQNKFIGDYQVGNHTFITCHGKDRADMRYALKPYPSKDNLEKIITECLLHIKKGRRIIRLPFI